MITEEEIAAKYGMTPREQGILTAIHYREANDLWDKLPEVAAWYDDLENSGEGVLKEYREAAKSCLHKGWIKVLTEADVEDDRLRWAVLPEQIDKFMPYEAGNVEFTASGAGIYGEIFDAWDRSQGRKPYLSFVLYVWDSPGQVRIESGARKRVSALVKKLKAGKTHSVFIDGEKVISIDPVIEIRNWWVTRFVCLPLAYSVKVFYEETEQAKEADVE